MSNRRGRPQARRGHGWQYAMVLMVGLLVGLGLALAWMVWGEGQEFDALLPRPDPAAEAAAAAPADDALATEPAPSFDFYTLLPERQVELPGQDAVPPTPVPGDATPAPPAGAAAVAPGLRLQAGAFRNPADAEALRANLALLGLSARIESAEVDGAPLHRVRLGPYEDARALERARRLLAEAGIQASPVR